MDSSNHINFADDTTMVGLISKNDKRAQSGHSLLFIDKSSVEIKSTKFLGVLLVENLTWLLNTNSISKKAQQCLYFLRRLRKAHLPPPILTMFYKRDHREHPEHHTHSSPSCHLKRETFNAATTTEHPSCATNCLCDRYQEFTPIIKTFSVPENIRLPPEVNRILYIRNLPYKITAEEMYDIFGKYGPIRQIRVGNTPETRGTAYVVYEDIFDAKNACDHLSGFNVCNRYLVVLYYNANRAFQKMDTKKKEEQLKLLKEKYGINTDPPK
ncbi:hypothetical protein QTP86_031311 [Hemibagrus guttatus]|nr:hypothetical protein QTP86_031311 [Hemibagrus guttatus]